MSLFSSIMKAVGLGNDDLAKQQEKQLKQQQENAKLTAANEVLAVTQFDETVDPSFAGADEDFRRKKSSTGAYASGIGLNI